MGDQCCDRTGFAVFVARFEDAEFVALRVGHHMPRHILLTDVDVPRAKTQCSFDKFFLVLQGHRGEVDVLLIRVAMRLQRGDELENGATAQIRRVATGGRVGGEATFDQARPEITEQQRLLRLNHHGNAVDAHASTVMRVFRRYRTECRHTVVARLSDAVGMTENRDTMTTSGAAADAALAVWLTMWNSGGDIARRICSEDFRIHFLNSEADGSNPGDDVVGAESFAEFLDAYRRRHPDVVFTEVARAVDGAHGRLLWDVRTESNAAGGVDVFDFTEDGLIREVWSVGGTRPHRS